MLEQVQEVYRLLTAYLITGNQEAVTSDDAVQIARRAIAAISNVPNNGPAGGCQRDLGSIAALFLLRSRELQCPHEHSIAADFLVPGDDIHTPLLHEACRCLTQHVSARLAYGVRSDFLAAECEWEMELLEQINEALLDSGGPAALDTAGVYWLAQLRWRRFLLLAETEAEAELTRSLAGFAAVNAPGRTLLPSLVREYLQCLDPGATSSGGLLDERYRSNSAMGIRRADTAHRVLIARINRERSPGDASDLALASALRMRAVVTGSLADARETARLAQGVWHRASGQPDDERTRAAELLIGARCLIGAATGDGAQLDAALQVGVDVVQGASADSWQTWSLVVNLAQVLVEQASQAGGVQQLDQALGLVQQITFAAQARHERGGYRSDEKGDLYVEGLFFTAVLLKHRHDLTGDYSSLSGAAAYATVAANAGEQSGRQWQRYGLSAAEIIFAKYKTGTSPAELDNAITIIRAVLWARRTDDDKPTLEERRFLAELLFVRFGQDRQIADQRETAELFIQLAREVADDPDYPRRASLLSGAANAAAASAASPAEVQEAVGWARQSLALSQFGSPNAAHAHFAVGQALLALHGLEDSLSALEEAIAHFEEAVSLPADEELRSGAAYQSARARLLRDEHIDRGVVDALAEAGGKRGTYRHNMAVLRAAALLEVARGQSAPSVPERATAIALLREVALAEDAATDLRVRAAQGWGHEALVLGDFADAADAFRSAIDAQPWQLWWAQPPDDQRAQIESLQGIAAIAASCAAQAGMLEHSVESLERGRAIVWGQVIQMRHAARLVAGADTALGERFRDALAAQEEFARYAAPESFDDYMSGFGAFLKQLASLSPHPADLRLRLAKDWNDMVTEARRMPGLEDVMQPFSAAQLRKAVASGTAVLVNMHERGSHALLVARDGIDNVPLPDLEIEDTARRIAEFTIAVHSLNDPDAEYGPELRQRITRTMDETRRWLWDVIARPVLHRLGLVRPPPPGEAWPRVWWCPTGVLSRLPLHAAGTDERPGSCVIDLAVSSYTISLTALQQAPAPAGSPARSILIVSSDDLSGIPELKGMEKEISGLRARFPGAVSSLDGPQATRRSVVREIPRHEFLHLACHVSPGINEQPPYLFLSDGPLRIERLGWTVSDNAQLAYLSGCSTAEAALEGTDEAHHLTAALQAAGFPNVIGTIWAADDETGVVVASQFYDRLNHAEKLSGQAVAESLHHTLRSIRDAGLPSFYWAPYVHYGGREHVSWRGR